MKHIFQYTLVILLWGCQSSAITTAEAPYAELPNPKLTDAAAWQQAGSGSWVSFASADVRYEKEKVPELKPQLNWKGKGWKGEKIHTKILIWTTGAIDQAAVQIHPLRDKAGNRIDSDHISVRFIRYVLTDSIGRNGSGCGIPNDLDSSLVEDALDHVSQLPVAANSSQPLWLSIQIPRDAAAGLYSGTLEVSGVGGSPVTLGYEVDVLNRTLPEPRDWSFHLDLWQNPFSISRVHGVEDWSDEHMKAMDPYMKMLADAGQKVITASIIYDPWNSQTYDVYKSMIKWTKKRDGSWEYDYRVFDQWVSYMLSLGIDREINCYSMIPWNLKFYYYDEALAKDTLIIATPGTEAYEQHWVPMLTDFAKHLRAKGWFDITTIAMDERPMEHMQEVFGIIRKADKDFKVSMAGNYHPEIERDLYNYCVASEFVLADSVLERRKRDGLVTTFYTACPEEYPNLFTFSPPAEGAFMGWYAAARNFDGYLRWAYNSWPENPLQDSRFGRWSGGDTYFIYPGARSSVRFERLIEGIQAYEKIRILQEEFSQNGNSVALALLNEQLMRFDIKATKATGAATLVNAANTVVNGF